jgi:hypothetical protein
MLAGGLRSRYRCIKSPATVGHYLDVRVHPRDDRNRQAFGGRLLPERDVEQRAVMAPPGPPPCRSGSRRRWRRTSSTRECIAVPDPMLDGVLDQSGIAVDVSDDHARRGGQCCRDRQQIRPSLRCHARAWPVRGQRRWRIRARHVAQPAPPRARRA